VAHVVSLAIYDFSPPTHRISTWQTARFVSNHLSIQV
jgi:hypothetical protein